MKAGILYVCAALLCAGCAQKESQDGVITLNLLTTKLSSAVARYPDTPVIQAMADRIGIRLNVIEADSNRYNVYIASGSGFDLILTPTTQFRTLIEGRVVQPMDPYLETYGTAVTENIAETVEFSRNEWSNDTGNLYFLPVQVGSDKPGMDQAIGLVTRWDYYKELGYPEINSLDEWLVMLAEMQRRYPTTPDGLPVYAISMVNDWNVWIYKFPLAAPLGYNELSGSASGVYKSRTTEYENLFAPDGLYWQSVEYYYKANRLGILDPDAFITRYDDFIAKGTNGQLLSGPAVWAMGDFNTLNRERPVGFTLIPTKWADQWGSGNNRLGWMDKCYAISAKTRYPEKCMEFINFIYSYEGARLLYNGVEGTNYVYENGVPVLTEATRALYEAGGEPFKESGIGFDRNLIGLNPFSPHPDDGAPLSLFEEADMYTQMMSAAQRDFSAYYGAEYPQQVFDRYIRDYGVKNQSEADFFIPALIPTPPDTIIRIEANLQERAIADAAGIILAANDAEYESRKQETMREFDRIGLNTVIDWYEGAWEAAREKAARYM